MKNNKEYYYGQEAEEKSAQLKKVKVDNEKWYIYYEDEETNDKYVKIYLEAHLHGGGPPRLIKISDFPF